MAQISFDVSAADAKTIGRIALRAHRMEKANRANVGSLLDWRMDITACHANGNPLRLDDLFAADDFNFAHDVFGIERHLDRETGKLTRCFLPRFRAREVEAA